jgi:MFS transporter, DHA1 family, multidrug resistance protein
VVIMSMVRDVTQGVQAAKLFGLLMTIEGVAPIIAPALGGYIDAHFGWRAVMVVLAVLGALVAVNSMVVLRETLPVNKREPLNCQRAIRTYARIARDLRFLQPALALSAVFFFLFAYIGGATFIYQNDYGLPAAQFGTLFGATGIAILIGASLAAKLVSKYGLASMAVAGACCIVAGALIACAAAAAGLGLYWLVAGVALALLGVGIAETTLMTLVMSSQTTALGSTAALLGAFQLGISACATPLTGLVSGHGATAWGGLLVLCAAVVGVLTWISVRQGKADQITALNH